MHDRIGVQFQLRAHEAQAGQAERLQAQDPQQARRMAFEISDRVDELERRDLLRVYDEVLPGSAARVLAARDRARALVR